MKKIISLFMALCMLLSLAACGTAPETQTIPAEEVQEEDLYAKAVELLENEQFEEAFQKLLQAAETGSTEAVEALARGILIDQYFLSYAQENTQRLFELSGRYADENDPWGLLLRAYCALEGSGSDSGDTDVFALLERAAQTDNQEVQSLALYDMGFLLSNGVMVDQNTKKAVEAYKKAAELGNAYAMVNIAEAYARGTYFTENQDIALSWYEKALEAGDEKAREETLALIDKLAEDYLFPEQGKNPDYEKAARYIELAAGQGDPNGLFYNGVLYHQGWGVERDVEKAIECYQKAIDAGSNAAAYNLGIAYTFGDEGIERDLEKGLDFFTQAAELGSENAADAMNSVAVSLRSGDGLPKDEELAMLWYQRAADAGSIYAWNNLASIYSSHSIASVEQDYDKALECYTRAAELGDGDAASRIHALAVGMITGDNAAEKNVEEGVRWLEKAAELGNVMSMRSLGYLNTSSAYQDVIEQDKATAIKWFEMAGNAGDPDSMEKLGALYAGDESGNADYAKALEWYFKAADACDPKDSAACKRIAAFINNIGVLCSINGKADYDPDLAFSAFSKAAKLGDQPAQYNLGKAYAIGLGTETDMDRAYELLGGIREDRDAFISDSGWFTSNP